MMCPSRFRVNSPAGVMERDAGRGGERGRGAGTAVYAIRPHTARYFGERSARGEVYGTTRVRTQAENASRADSDGTERPLGLGGDAPGYDLVGFGTTPRDRGDGWGGFGATSTPTPARPLSPEPPPPFESTSWATRSTRPQAPAAQQSRQRCYAPASMKLPYASRILCASLGTDKPTLEWTLTRHIFRVPSSPCPNTANSIGVAVHHAGDQSVLATLFTDGKARTGEGGGCAWASKTVFGAALGAHTCRNR
ncbi:hypothetical protein B0H17DRAFT_1328286 [Mycena rosella]|uniref:Uncharacterized protein n=1 Tax=Mycena rosella TaxID=1033263 RepID=A0AAD7DTC8_MYCRO|nr:hypothetical protein B0H17DRAFT_1328286 [Mycena rosella]